MSQLFNPLAQAGLMQQGANDLQGVAALLMRAQENQQRQRQWDAEMQLRQQDEQRRAADEARRAQAWQQSQDQMTAGRTYDTQQYQQFNPAPVPQGNEGDFFMQSPQQHGQQMQAFTGMDPASRAREMERMREEQTWEGARRAGLRASDVGPAQRGRYIEYLLSRNLDPEELMTMATAPSAQDSIDSQYLGFQMGGMGPGPNPAAVSPQYLSRERGYQQAGEMLGQRQDFSQGERIARQQFSAGQQEDRQLYGVERDERQFSNRSTLQEDQQAHAVAMRQTVAKLQSDPTFIGFSRKIEAKQGEVKRFEAEWDDYGKIKDDATRSRYQNETGVKLQRAYQELHEIQSQQDRYVSTFAAQAAPTTAPATQPSIVSPMPMSSPAPAPAPAPQVTPQQQAALQSALQRAMQELGPNANREAVKARARQILGGQ